MHYSTAPLFFLFFSLGSGSDVDDEARRLPTDTPFVEDLKLNLEHTLSVGNNDDHFYVIRMPARNQPFFLTVTPCQRPVHWQLRIPNQFAVQPNVHPRPEHLSHVLHMRIPPLIELPEAPQQRERLVLLAGEENEKRMTFYANAIEADRVVLNVSSSHHTSVKVFATTSKAELDAVYPALPENTTVSFVLGENEEDGTAEVELSWTAAPMPKDSVKHRYCVLISHEQPQYAICEENEDLDSIHCVDSKQTKMRVRGLRPGQRYYATVHVHNQQSGGSSAFHPVEFRTATRASTLPAAHSAESDMSLAGTIHEIEDGVLMKHTVSGPKGQANDYKYVEAEGATADGKLLLIVHACNGYVRVAIYKNDALLQRTDDFVGLRQFAIVRAKGDRLRVSVINDDQRAPVDYRIYASEKWERTPFAQLPDDRSIRAVARGCDSVVLRWLRAEDDRNVRYCVHRKIRLITASFHETRPDYFAELVRERTAMCWAEMPVGRTAVCLHANESEPVGGPRFPSALAGPPLQTTLRGLQPATTYRLDVSAQRVDAVNSQPLAFRPLFVRTRDHC
ncbi:Protein NDNF [Aphelenchoides fujianensis]|nr:Protein NDNF [Aphelenchoides fujianensis]